MTLLTCHSSRFLPPPSHNAASDAPTQLSEPSTTLGVASHLPISQTIQDVHNKNSDAIWFMSDAHNAAGTSRNAVQRDIIYYQYRCPAGSPGKKAQRELYSPAEVMY